MAYTYLLGWSRLDKWYYGVSYRKGCRPSDLWKTYFSSSKYVDEFRKQNGEPDIIQVRKIFKDEKSALIWESTVLRRMNVINDDRWLNQTNNKAISTQAAIKGSTRPKSLNMRKKLSKTRTGMKHSDETKKKISLSKIGKKISKKSPMTSEHRKKLSDFGKTLIGSKNPFYGKKHTKSTKEKISNKKKGVKIGPMSDEHKAKLRESNLKRLGLL